MDTIRTPPPALLRTPSVILPAVGDITAFPTAFLTPRECFPRTTPAEGSGVVLLRVRQRLVPELGPLKPRKRVGGVRGSRDPFVERAGRSRVLGRSLRGSEGARCGEGPWRWEGWRWGRLVPVQGVRYLLPPGCVRRVEVRRNCFGRVCAYTTDTTPQIV